MLHKIKRNSTFLIFFLSVFLLSFLASLVTKGNLEPWYSQLTKPGFSPPNWVFAPVWTFLYIIIAWVGAYLWNRSKDKLKDKLVLLWFSQMILNFAWSFIFFGAHELFWSLVDLSAMIIVVAILTCYLKKIDTYAFWGFVLYLVWLIYAGILNGMLAWINR